MDQKFSMQILLIFSYTSHTPNPNVPIRIATVKCASICTPVQADAIWHLQATYKTNTHLRLIFQKQYGSSWFFLQTKVENKN